MEEINEVGRFERRVQQQRESYYVSLPISWIKTNGLRRYDEVIVEIMSDGSLRVSKRVEHDSN
ncbi:MAG: AbrB/MazE/SpoVT family DNA-binding domain-containing protein [Candidatus Thermoplasmatota archaeon]|jgi:phosphate uptake regulator|nr:AbrB/MazE/SpoVT family DNA-binding domain-containing protein [Candidatus Thermoplasmatota archaeon]